MWPFYFSPSLRSLIHFSDNKQAQRDEREMKRAESARAISRLLELSFEIIYFVRFLNFYIRINSHYRILCRVLNIVWKWKKNSQQSCRWFTWPRMLTFLRISRRDFSYFGGINARTSFIFFSIDKLFAGSSHRHNGRCTEQAKRDHSRAGSIPPSRPLYLWI